MIKKIRIQNFQGIDGFREISFEGDKKRYKSKMGVVTKNNHDILLTSALMGKNASGKSSFIDGVDFIVRLANKNVYLEVESSLERKMHRQNKNDGKDSVFKFYDVLKKIKNIYFNDEQKQIKLYIELIDHKNIISMDIKISPTGVVSEKIIFNGEIYSNKKNKINEFQSSIFDKDLKFKRVAFVPTFSIFNEAFGMPIIHAVDDKIITKKTMLNWMALADDKIIDLEWSSNTIKKIVLKRQGKLDRIPVSQLSSGTMKWLNIGGEILTALLKKQSFVLIDEISRSLHPFLAKFIIDLFGDKKINKKKSQLLFTSHQPYVVDGEFRKDAINYIDEFGKIINIGRDLKVRNDIVFSKNYIHQKLGSHPNQTDLFNFMEDLNE